ncbi:uncharacterized protein STEHIDRAFT_155811 [Stereum hirsutum FP-91666 SS1]|uniref:uncharacterized protein n=1 Tax=Stereum hirsutum (strain FP-91666) TaxID=721885 RepID=UPI000440CD4F|nr:uncharacterized protein STEHIDRAFT_155811 [Stereum hirsutum FP-91666 SS1]EIM88458.1 hypothetical protein STEHIDRAFT_155811 [Stereum hirsutum FP-91666 SS1]
MEETTTAKYVHSLAFALHPISPALAACHASRARLLRPPTLHSDSARRSYPPSSCPRCGIFLLDGTGQVRSVHSSTSTRKRKRNGKGSSSSSAGRFSEITCSSCGHVERTPRPVGNAALFPKVRRRAPSAASGFDSARTIAPIPQSSRPTAAAIAVSNPPLMHTSSPSPSTPSHQQPPPSIPPPPPPSTTHTRPQSSTPQPPQPPPPPPPTTTTKKARAKKRSGLQELLARNKEKQTGNKEGDGPGSGLASFLSSL